MKNLNCRTSLTLALLTGLMPLVAGAQLICTTNNGSLTIVGFTGQGVAVIPPTMNGWPVTGIGTNAFLSNSNLTGVTIPTSVTNISPSAFAFCTNLASVVIPGSVKNIGFDAFGNCSALTNVTISQGVGSIGVAAFTSCNKLTSVAIPSSVTNFGDLAFGSQNLVSMFFQGNAPHVDQSFSMVLASVAIIYYVPGAANWGAYFGNYPTALWNPTIKIKDDSFGIHTNRFGFNINGTTNIPIIVEACTNLVNPAWTTLLNCTLTNGAIYFSDAASASYPRRTYRIRSP